MTDSEIAESIGITPAQLREEKTSIQRSNARAMLPSLLRATDDLRAAGGRPAIRGYYGRVLRADSAAELTGTAWLALSQVLDLSRPSVSIAYDVLIYALAAAIAKIKSVAALEKSSGITLDWSHRPVVDPAPMQSVINALIAAREDHAAAVLERKL